MDQTAKPIASRERLWRLALAFLPGLVLVLLRGADANWDLRNYHLYDPHAWWTGRMLLDVAPAQLQSWHNPLLDLPLYWLVQSGWDLRWSSIWLFLPHGLAIYLLLVLQARLSPVPPTRTAQVVLALLALSGATTWATAGNSMNDGFVAAALLGSLALLAREAPLAARHWLLAGLLAGAMMGLKLTASVYCLALAAAAFAGRRERGVGRLGADLGALAAGGLGGFLLTYGWWGWTLNELYGNPFFPYFNDVFQSPWAPARDFVDARFRADSLLELLAIPLQLLTDDTARSELYVRDPRLLAGALGLPWLALRLRHAAPGLSRVAARLALFFWAGLLAWGWQYGIYRYAQPLEMLGALALVLWVARAPRLPWLALLLALVLVSKATHRPDWGHVRPAAPRYGLTPAPLPTDAMVVVAGGEPLAYVSLALPPRVRMVALSNNLMTPTGCSGLERRAREALAAHRGSLWLLSTDPDAAARDARALRESLGLRADSADRRTYASDLGGVIFTPLQGPLRMPSCGGDLPGWISGTPNSAPAGNRKAPAPVR